MPAYILQEEFLKPLQLSQRALARALHIDPMRINQIVNGNRAVTADTDLRLTHYFGLSAGFFLRLQLDHDVVAAQRAFGAELDGIGTREA